MHLALRLTPYSLTAIGRRLDRDHTSILHGCRHVETLMRADAEFCLAVVDLEERLQ